MELTSSHLDEAVACADPECGATAEPEQDGEHRYYECPACGFAFGYQRLRPQAVGVNPDGACAVGIPEDVRRRASQPFETAQARTRLPLLTIGRPPNAAAP